MDKKPESKERFIKRTKLECPVCKNHRFWSRETLMNTKGLTFLKLDWANKTAQNYICDNCGYVYWFMEQ